MFLLLRGMFGVDGSGKLNNLHFCGRSVLSPILNVQTYFS